MGKNDQNRKLKITNCKAASCWISDGQSCVILASAAGSIPDSDCTVLLEQCTIPMIPYLNDDFEMIDYAQQLDDVCKSV